MVKPKGPGATFALLFDDEMEDGSSLPESFQAIYGGDWRLPVLEDRPYLYMNFAVSRDGRVSFNEPGRMGGGDVSGFNTHDQWLMGLLRARADAILIGDNTLRTEPEHIWTAEYIGPCDAAAFAVLRSMEGRRPAPLQVVLSLTGDLPVSAAVFQRPDLHIVVATTTRGSTRARVLASCPARVDILDLGVEACDLAKLMHVLFESYAVRSLLCEGGPRVYGSLLQAGQVDDEFVTLCPLVIGSRFPERFRPSLVEGVAFSPDSAPRLRPIALRRAGDHLFLHSRRDA